MNAPFRFYDPTRASHATRNRVPHLEQPGVTYFATFRLADSVPVELLAEFVRQKEQWLAMHPEKTWSEEIEREYHRRFSKRFERWLDRGYGSCLLRVPHHATILAEALAHFEGERSTMHSWVIMPNHVHVMFTLLGDYSLASLMHSWKGFSARRINAAAGRQGGIWQKSYYDRMIRDWDHFSACARYIRNNPNQAKLRPGEWLHHESPLVQRLLA